MSDLSRLLEEPEPWFTTGDKNSIVRSESDMFIAIFDTEETAALSVALRNEAPRLLAIEEAARKLSAQST